MTPREERESRWEEENAASEAGLDKAAARAYYKVRRTLISARLCADVISNSELNRA